MENLADRRKMENQRKIPLKSEICCKNEVKFGAKVVNLGKMTQIRG